MAEDLALLGIDETKPGTISWFPMKHLLVTLAVAALLAAQPAKVNSLLTRDLPDLPGKEAIMITVEYAPGASSDVHRHNAHVFVYVLEGSIVMQVEGGQPLTLSPGQTFYENPKDIHLVGRNASKTNPAKFLVFMVKDKGAPVAVPAK